MAEALFVFRNLLIDFLTYLIHKTIQQAIRKQAESLKAIAQGNLLGLQFPPTPRFIGI